MDNLDKHTRETSHHGLAEGWVTDTMLSGVTAHGIEESMAQYSSRLRACPIFAGVGEDVITVFLIAAHIRRVRKGSHFFLHSAPASAFYLLVAGRVSFVLDTVEGYEVGMSMIGPSDVFGLATLVGADSYDDNAIALDNCVALWWERETLGNLLQHYLNVLAINIFRYLYQRQIFYQERWEAALGRTEQRLATALLRLAEDPGYASLSASGVRVSVTQYHLAAHIGAHYSTVSRILTRWKSENLAHPGRGYVMLRQLEQLSAIADGSHKGVASE